MIVRLKILGVINILCLLRWHDYTVGSHGAYPSKPRHLHGSNSSSCWPYIGAFGLLMGVGTMAFKTMMGVPSVTNATKTGWAFDPRDAWSSGHGVCVVLEDELGDWWLRQRIRLCYEWRCRFDMTMLLTACLLWKESNSRVFCNVSMALRTAHLQSRSRSCWLGPSRILELVKPIRALVRAAV